MAILGRVFPPVVDLKGTELILDADADTTITADTDDQIDIKIAGADDFSFKANTFEVQTGSNIDMNGTELILDANGNTSITADTDDQIDFKIAGADDFQMTANSFNVLSGSTLTIDSGATITNSGTANNFGTDPESAYAGVLQTNANFVDQVIFGPAVDGKAWNGLWSKASVFSSLMLATIEDEGSNTEINIWDLTEQSSGAISTTPLATVDLSAAATPTSIAAAMGYIIVGSEDGIAIIDPHSGSWAERTTGWPKSLNSTATASGPILTNNDVQSVAAGLSRTSPLDPRTGGPLPVFACAYGTGADVGSLIKYDGNVFDYAGTIGPTVCGFVDDRIAVARENSGNQLLASTATIDLIVADDWGVAAYAYDGNAQQFFLGANTGAAFHNQDSVFADTTGLTIRRNDFIGSTGAMQGVSAEINRTYNTGFKINYTVGAWLANSKTVDRSGKANTMTENGTVTEAAVESGCELLGYSGWSTSNYLQRASDSDWDVVNTGTLYMSIWMKTSNASGNDILFEISNSDETIEFFIMVGGAGLIQFRDDGATAQTCMTTSQAYNDSKWHKVDFVRVSSTERYAYVDGVLTNSSTTDAGSIGSSGNLPLTIGMDEQADAPAQNSTMALAKLSTTAPNATQIRQMYDAEKGMFVASAECLLQSGSTDAVLDVNIDPLTSKVIVTQTDAITIFDGLVVDSKPTVNSGASEKGKLWGALRAEQNSANAYVTAPAVDQRQVNEMVRGLASDMPGGVDLSKAKAWLLYDQSAPAITSSYNVKSVTDNSAGNYTVNFAIPFKIGSQDSSNASYTIVSNSSDDSYAGVNNIAAGWVNIKTRDNAGSLADAVRQTVVCFGELENE